ncbi:MAG TPA: flagellar biosynthesis protein FliQ [Pirellulales bacterium]|jgi:flagellar biosynthetic protein FliQ
MDPQDAIGLAREAVMLTLWISAPVLIVGMVIGLVVGLIQALTQIQEQTVAFVPKLFAMIIVLSITLPWLMMQLVDYTHDLIMNIPRSM